MISQQFLSRISLKRDQVSSFDEYPFCLPAVSTLDYLALHPKVTFFVGENGSGKSTLLEAIAVALEFNAEGGTKNFNFATQNSHSSLHEYLRIARGIKQPKDGFFLRAESFYNVASEIDNLGVQGSYGGKSLHHQSHGEAFLSLINHRFKGKGLYLLDEPEAALSPQRQLSLLTRIHDLVEDQSQFVIATHSPILLAYPGAKIVQFDSTGINEVAFEDTEHYKLTRDFLNHPQRYLHKLLGIPLAD